MHDLIEVMKILRSPRGCPWDRKQTYESLMACLLEEAHEIVEATVTHAYHNLAEELGDLLCIVAMITAMAERDRLFSYETVVDGAIHKMKRRHPHVFGSARARTFRQAYSLWQRAKEAEHRIQSRRSVLDDLGPGVPALMRADKIQRRVARVGFDWPDQAGVVAKIEEELAEFKRELRRPRTSQRKLQEELGDMLFALANLGRKLDLSSEIALRKTNAKFIKRFRALEKRLADAHQRLGTVPLRVLDRYWNAVKRDERSPGRPSHSRVRKKAAQRGG